MNKVIGFIGVSFSLVLLFSATIFLPKYFYKFFLGNAPFIPFFFYYFFAVLAWSALFVTILSIFKKDKQANNTGDLNLKSYRHKRLWIMFLAGILTFIALGFLRLILNRGDIFNIFHMTWSLVTIVAIAYVLTSISVPKSKKLNEKRDLIFRIAIMCSAVIIHQILAYLILMLLSAFGGL